MSKLTVCLRHISEVFLYEYYCLGDDEYEISEEDTLTPHKTKAKEMLLSGDMKIYEVADALGFESAYYFSKVFKKMVGVAPSDYVKL